MRLYIRSWSTALVVLGATALVVEAVLGYVVGDAHDMFLGASLGGPWSEIHYFQHMWVGASIAMAIVAVCYVIFSILICRGIWQMADPEY